MDRHAKTALIPACVDDFPVVTLAELEWLSLRDRVESKAIMPLALTPHLIRELSGEFLVLEHERSRSQLYRNLYFDTEDLDFYTDHHNKKLHRHKIRYRSYVDSDVSFLEVKQKLNTGRTVKHRTRVDDVGVVDDDQAALIREHTGHEPDLLAPVITIDYHRVTFAAWAGDERVTLDFGLTFSSDDRRLALDSMVIFEVKQAELMHHSPAMEALRRCGLHTTSMSKYCAGVASCVDAVKTNRFKPLLGRIDRTVADNRAQEPSS